MSQSVPYYRFPGPADGRGRTPQPEGAWLIGGASCGGLGGEVFHDVMLYCDYVLASDYERQAAEIESLKRDCEEKDDLSDQLLATSVRLRAALEQIAANNDFLFLAEMAEFARDALAVSRLEPTHADQS